MIHKAVEMEGQDEVNYTSVINHYWCVILT